MTRTAAAMLLALALGCRSEDKPAARREVTLEVDPSRARPPTTTLPASEPLRLLEPGAEPRAPLRYALASSPSRVAIETRVTARELAGPTWSEPRELAPLHTGFTVTPSTTGLAVTALPGATEGAWSLVADRRFTITVDERGRATAFAVADDRPSGPAIVDELAQRWLALAVPLPDEPVGVGARWRAVTMLRQRPAVVKQTATYTLTAQTPAGWEIAVEIARIAQGQEAVDPGIPAGTNVDVVALVTRINGAVSVERTRALPEGQLAIESTLHLRVRTRNGATEHISEDLSTVRIRHAGEAM